MRKSAGAIRMEMIRIHQRADCNRPGDAPAQKISRSALQARRAQRALKYHVMQINSSNLTVIYEYFRREGTTFQGHHHHS